MPVWPVSLPPAPLLDGFVETVPETVIRSNMDQGPAKLRQRTTAGVREFRLRFLMDKTQTAFFDQFFITDLNGGAQPFDFTHPRTGETLSLRFKRPPEYQSQNAKYFLIICECEALP